MARAQFPRIIGVNQLADETSLTTDEAMFVRSAANTDIDSAGNTSRRAGFTPLFSGSGYHSIKSTKRGWLMVCLKNQLGVISNDAFVPLADMEAPDYVSYAELNGNLYAFSRSFSCMFKPNDTAAYDLGVQLPNPHPQFAAAAGGGLRAGSYGVTYSLVDEDGEESPLGPIKKIDLDTDGSVVGTLFTIIPGYKYRIYMTTTDGEELYEATEFDADRASISIGSHIEGRQPATRNLDYLPHGHIVRAFNSRLLVGGTGFVHFSEAFRPHLCDTAHGFIHTTGITLMLEALTEGVYVGDKRGVRFYAGKDPEQWQAKSASDDAPIYGTSLKVPGSFFRGDLSENEEVVIWLTARGYQAGLPNGEVMPLNAGQVYLPQYVQGSATTAIRDGRKQVICPVNSNELTNVSVALDSATV